MKILCFNPDIGNIGTQSDVKESDISFDEDGVRIVVNDMTYNAAFSFYKFKTRSTKSIVESFESDAAELKDIRKNIFRKREMPRTPEEDGAENSEVVISELEEKRDGVLSRMQDKIDSYIEEDKLEKIEVTKS